MQNNWKSKVGDHLKASLLLVCLYFCFFFKADSLRIPSSHQFYALQVTEWVQQSKSMGALNRCKQQCLQMKDYFPFRFRYHRLIYRQTNGFVKYITGNCQVKMNLLGIEYVSWSHLQSYINATNLFGNKDLKNQGQAKVWQAYYQVCEDPILKMSEQRLKQLKLVRIHSDFQYYDDERFKNLHPFTDIGSMLTSLMSRIKK